MTRTALLDALAAPTFGGLAAPLVSAAALAIPTGILSLDQALPAGACCTTYFPFVMISALLVRPIYASIVALGSAGLADALFMGPRYQLFESPMDTFGDTASLISSAFVIGLVCVFRVALAQSRKLAGQAFGLSFGKGLSPRGEVAASPEPAAQSYSEGSPILPAQLADQVRSDFETLVAVFDLRLSIYRGRKSEPEYLALERARNAALHGLELSGRLSGKIQS